jgi:hypothetical protein
MTVKLIEVETPGATVFYIGGIAALSRGGHWGGEISRIQAWCEDNFGEQEIRWHLRQNALWFDDPTDAFAFKLVWG